MPAYHYNLDEVACVIMGVPITEYSDGGGVEVAFADVDWDVKQGHQGSVVRFKKVNGVATISIKVLMGSPTNANLQAVVDADRRTGLGAGAFSVVDTNGTSLASAARAWCTKTPDMAFTTEPGEVEWEFQCANPEVFHGANRLA